METKNKPVPGASMVINLAIPISPGWAQVDAWLKEKHGWSLASWLETFIKTTLQCDNNSEEIIAMDLEDKFKLPRSEFMLNVNAMLVQMDRPIHQFDKANRIVHLESSKECPRCKGTSHGMIGELIIEGKSQFIGCDVCLTRDGYIPKYPKA